MKNTPTPQPGQERVWRKKHYVSMVFAGLGLVFFAITLYAKAAEQKKTQETLALLELFGESFERVRENYVDSVDERELIEAAIAGMVSNLDPHSSYISAENFKAFQEETRGRFGGLGIEIALEDGYIKIISPIDDTPAYKAGLQPDDFITHIDGDDILGVPLQESVRRMRGKVGTSITLTIRRGEDSFDLTLRRATIPVTAVKHRTERNIGYLRMISFNENTFSNLRDSIDKVKQESSDSVIGYVLDLRNNPGGLLNQAIKVSDAFLERGEIVSTRGRNGANAQRFLAKSGDLTGNKPMVVLINNGSASASEIVAGALQDHKRAVIMGTQSFGKGSVQNIIPLHSKPVSALKLTVQRYYTPSGRSIQARGITPDIVVEPTPMPENENESSLPKEEKPESESALEISDYQLSRAYDLLHGIAIGQTTGE